MAETLEETLRLLKTDPAQAIDLYKQLYGAEIFAPVRRGTESSIELMQFLTYQSDDSLRELPVFTRYEYADVMKADDLVFMKIPGQIFWFRMLDIVNEFCLVAVNLYQPHSIRINRRIILGMVNT